MPTVHAFRFITETNTDTLKEGEKGESLRRHIPARLVVFMFPVSQALDVEAGPCVGWDGAFLLWARDMRVQSLREKRGVEYVE